MILRTLVLVCLIFSSALRAQELDSPQPAPSGVEAGGLAGEFARGLFTPGNSAKLAVALLYDQTTVAVPEWGSSRAGLDRRAQWLAARYLTRYTTEFTAEELLGTDTSYHRCRCKGFSRRAAHALRAEFVERRSDGSDHFAFARMTGISSSVALTAPMLPAGYGVADLAKRSIAVIGVDEGFNMLQEFWPEIKRTLLLRKK